MRRIAVILPLALAGVPAYAYETAGKFGVGAGFSLIPFLPNASVVWGITNVITLSPSFTILSISPSDGPSGNLISIGVDTYLPVIRADRANFNVKLGGYFLTSNENLFNTTTTAANFGFGIEHFVNDNFSVYIGARSMFLLTRPATGGASTTIIGLTSQFLDFRMTNYLR